jgi:hypothetical protein
VASVMPRWLTLVCLRKRWMGKQSLVVPCMKPVTYFRQLCKVMSLPSEFRHVTQKLSYRTYKYNRMCDITELVGFNLRTLHLGEDYSCTPNQTRVQVPSGYRLVQKDSAPWIECAAVCVNTCHFKVTAADQLTVNRTKSDCYSLNEVSPTDVSYYYTLS